MSVACSQELAHDACDVVISPLSVAYLAQTIKARELSCPLAFPMGDKEKKQPRRRGDLTSSSEEHDRRQRHRDSQRRGREELRHAVLRQASASQQRATSLRLEREPRRTGRKESDKGDLDDFAEAKRAEDELNW